MEPELRPKFIEKMKKREKKSTVKIDDLNEHFGIDDKKERFLRDSAEFRRRMDRKGYTPGDLING